MDTEKIRIDWRAQFDQLKPYIDGAGGIVSVSYHGEPCAPNAFVTTLRSVHAGGPQHSSCSSKKMAGCTIIIDRENYTVRYLSELCGEFERCLGIKLIQPKKYPENFTSTVASNNSAGGDQHIETHLHFNDGAESMLLAQRDCWIDSLFSQLKTILATQRVMIILMHGDESEQREFWENLWKRCLCKFVEHGLVLVRMIDASSPTKNRGVREAKANCFVNLPSYLDPSQQNSAREDIATWIEQELSVSPVTADAFAHSFVQSNRDDIARLHDNVGFWLHGLRTNS